MSDLVTRDLSVSYGDNVALAQVDLQLSAGTFIAVIGPTGAGKTTLLWALAGAQAASNGSVVWKGEPVTDHDTAARAGIALMPQGNGLAAALTAAENITIPLLGGAIAPAEAARRTHEALVQVGLEDSGRNLIEELSGGQQQRVALARILARRAEVLLVDEPTSELDASNRVRVAAALRAEAARGAVVVMTTHDHEAAEEADAVLDLNEGTLTGPPTMVGR